MHVKILCLHVKILIFSYILGGIRGNPQKFLSFQEPELIVETKKPSNTPHKELDKWPLVQF